MLKKFNMRSTLILVLLALAVLFTFIIFFSQSREGFRALPSLDEEFKLKVGEKALIRDLNLIITFNQITEDSRCPINVYCFWSGRVSVEISVTKKVQETESIILTMPSAEKRELDGYVIVLLKVEPPKEYPDKVTIPQSSYEITLKISRESY